ncbi:MAG: hypothetical protein ACC646_12360, partial [Paracoccaceae bacterium]
MSTAPDLHQTISRLVRRDRGRLLSALIAGLGNFALAEDAFSDALESALIHWARSGLPDNPQGWLLRVARPVHFLQRWPERSAFGDRHRAVQPHHRRRFKTQQAVVKHHDLRPVGGCATILKTISR